MLTELTAMNQGFGSGVGLLSVHVGKSRFSSTNGKYLLVSNRYPRCVICG